jgi:SAM-dependent methyltransferase
MSKFSQPIFDPGMHTYSALYEHDDFMESIGTLVDLGCGSGQDLERWATATTRDDGVTPLNIRCVGVDQIDTPVVIKKYNNITYQKTDFEATVHPLSTKLFDILWCNNAFQYCLNPVATLSKWWHIASEGAMIILIVPQTTNFEQKRQAFYQPSGCYYHHTMVSLIHMLATAGWDCKTGFFIQRPGTAWNHVIAYKSNHPPMDPKSVSWYQLQELDLLPDSVCKSVQAHGYPKQQELVLPWLDKSLNYIV